MATSPRSDHLPSLAPSSRRQKIWLYVSRSPLASLWNLEGVPPRVILRNTWNSLFSDNLLGRSAELGFYFIFALFPTLFTACSILGMAARSAPKIYNSLLLYLAIVVPPAALGTVLQTFNQTTTAASSDKLTFGFVAAIWSASVGFSAIQDSLNVVYRVKEARPYLRARLSAIGVTILLSVIMTMILATLLCGDLLAHLLQLRTNNLDVASVIAILVKVASWIVATALLTLLFAVVYYFGPDVEASRWHWLSPGAAVGIVGWLLASLGLRLYVHLFFNAYSAAYGSLGAVIILLTWFYLSGLMLLLGGEINSEIEAAVKEKRLRAAGVLDSETRVYPGESAPI